MTQVTWRANDEIVKRVQHFAASEGMSMNELITRVLSAATDSDERDPESVRLRDRLRAAGMLAVWRPSGERPTAAEVERARAAAAVGTPLADIIASNRR